MTKKLLVLGLHITKCAGTSLMTTIRRDVSDNAYSIFSSYYENFLASRPMLSSVVDKDRLRFVFGHYTHETLLSVFKNRQIFLFTGLREPVARAVSHFGQINVTRAAAGLNFMPVDAYLEEHRNTLCQELLRAFPRAAEFCTGPIWMQARAALSLFDYIYSTEHFDHDISFILEKLGLKSDRLIADNTMAGRDMDTGVREYIKASENSIKEAAKKFFDQDLTLYAEMASYQGQKNWRQTNYAAPWMLDRDLFVEALPDEDLALEKFSRLEVNYLVNEFYEIGRISSLRKKVIQEIGLNNLILAEIDRFPN